ncbi:MAG TPA: hypothetical protein VNY05_19865 [Candidatus Acidoferrales bacterium]|jgi:hypothetical protein|nr:hypothetical protein [Candidatus Acidoferrales bacterium]
MEWTVHEFGERAALRYDTLIKQALKDIRSRSRASRIERTARDADCPPDGKTDAGELLKDAALRLLEDARFHAAVLEGKAYADRSEFIEEEEMDARFEQMLRS